ncbi:hypothetical protein PGB90_006576 [Kerria lacca]
MGNHFLLKFLASRSVSNRLPNTFCIVLNHVLNSSLYFYLFIYLLLLLFFL